MTTIEQFHELSVQDKLTWIWEQLNCTIEPLLEQLVMHIVGDDE